VCLLSNAAIIISPLASQHIAFSILTFSVDCFARQPLLSNCFAAIGQSSVDLTKDFLFRFCFEQGYGVGGEKHSNYDLSKISDSRLGLSKISDSRLHKVNETWMLKSMEIVVHSKKSLFQQKFQKKLYHFNRNFQFRSVM